jgi:hypothetical protein
MIFFELLLHSKNNLSSAFYHLYMDIDARVHEGKLLLLLSLLELVDRDTDKALPRR